jgi:hypothetical protein
MTTKTVVLLLVVAFAMFAASAQTVRPVDPFAAFPAGKTYWANERGSTIRIDNLGGGKLSGAFTTAVGCGVGAAQPLAGAYSGNSVSFVVNFGAACPSTTAWSGTLITGTPIKIRTLWLLTKGGVPSWDSIIAGADSFTRIELAAAPAVLQK